MSVFIRMKADGRIRCQMDDYRAGNYVIGSQMMKLTCEEVVSERLKGSGRRWSE